MRFCGLYTWVMLIALAAVLQSCGSAGDSPPKTGTLNDTPGAHAAAPPATAIADTALNNTTDIDTSAYATVYLVIADTGQDYYSLRNKMQVIAATHKWKIDTLGRYYNKIKKEIVVPDDDEDEMYRGEYFPRRSINNTLSLEYYRSYNDISTVKNIALITAICDRESEADSLLTMIREEAPASFVHRTKLYMGCMH